MLLDMDTELQHLISISVDKMTSEADSSLADRGSQKSGVMDLRKALLVAHFMQKVRQAYFEENYEIVSNTFSNMDYIKCTDSLNSESQRHFEDYPLLQVSNVASSQQSNFHSAAVTNSEVVVSKISQITRPLSVAVNTSHVMCCQSSTDPTDLKSKNDIDDAVPVFCDELDVSSCCEVVSCAPDEHVMVSAEAESHDHMTPINRMADRSGNESRAEDEVITQKESPALMCSAVNSSSKLAASADSSILPKKKRPLPSDYLELCKTPAVKAPKIVSNIGLDPGLNKTCQKEDSTEADCTTSIAHTVILESRTSTSLATVCSVIGRSPLNENFQQNPKVVVQLTQSCDSYMPITCTQLRMGKHLSNLTAQAF